MKDQLEYLADFCRKQIKGRPDDAQWETFAAHWDKLAVRYGAKPRPQQRQQSRAKPKKYK